MTCAGPTRAPARVPAGDNLNTDIEASAAAVATHVVVFLAPSVPLAGSEERMQLADSFVAARLFLRSVSLSIPENSPSLGHIFKTFISGAVFHLRPRSSRRCFLRRKKMIRNKTSKTWRAKKKKKKKKKRGVVAAAPSRARRRRHRQHAGPTNHSHHRGIEWKLQQGGSVENDPADARTGRAATRTEQRGQGQGGGSVRGDAVPSIARAGVRVPRDTIAL